ncbi:MAG: glycosyltransferase, partial [Rhodococcus sp. (in: high G+C Gram-positive bacteria)]
MNSSVTVITITRNDLSGLVRTIESVRTQSARGVEHIVIDGGSTDGTVEYLDSLGDSLVWNTGL